MGAVAPNDQKAEKFRKQGISDIKAGQPGINTGAQNSVRSQTEGDSRRSSCLAAGGVENRSVFSRRKGSKLT